MLVMFEKVCWLFNYYYVLVYIDILVMVSVNVWKDLWLPCDDGFLISLPLVSSFLDLRVHDLVDQ